MKEFNMESLDWSKQQGLIPAIIQDAETKQVLMLGYMNQEALTKTLQTGLVTFYSRTKQRIWVKGETSDNYLKLIDIRQDCDNDSILILAHPSGPTCHLGTQSCFGTLNKADSQFLSELENLIAKRIKLQPEKSYITNLYQQGLSRIAQKVGEEAVETVIAAIDNSEDFCNEAADLIFHLLILLQCKGKNFKSIIDILKDRSQ